MPIAPHLCMNKIGRTFLFLLILAGSTTASANVQKIVLQSQAIALDRFTEPNPDSLDKARKLFTDYRQKVDHEAVEYLPHIRVEENVVLYLHSFTQGPHEIKGLHDIFTSNNFNVLALSFSGHELDENGNRRENFADYEPANWVTDVQFAVRLAKQYGKKIWIMGYSTGGLLAVQQVLLDSSRIKAMILVSPALALDQFAAGYSCIGSNLFGGFVGDETRIMMEGGCLIRGTITKCF